MISLGTEPNPFKTLNKHLCSRKKFIFGRHVDAAMISIRLFKEVFVLGEIITRIFHQIANLFDTSKGS
jgi:hypothetical protein